MTKRILLLPVLTLVFQAGCGVLPATFTSQESAASTEAAIVAGREWGFARAMHACSQFRAYCEQEASDDSDCQRELTACIEASEREFSPQPVDDLEPVVSPGEIAPAIKRNRASDASMDYAKCMNWCWRSHRFCKEHQSGEIDCDHQLGVCIEACESEFDPQFGLTVRALEGSVLE